MSDPTDKSGDPNVVKIDMEVPPGPGDDSELSREEISVIPWQSGHTADDPDVCESCQATQSVVTSKQDSDRSGLQGILRAPVATDRKATKGFDSGPYTDYITQKRLTMPLADAKLQSSGVKIDELQIKPQESDKSQGQVDDGAKPPYKAVASKRKLFHAKKSSLLSPSMKKKKRQSADVGPMEEHKRERSLTSNVTTEGFTVHENASLTRSYHSLTFADTGSDIDQEVHRPTASENGIGIGPKFRKGKKSYGSDTSDTLSRSKISRSRLGAPRVKPSHGNTRNHIDVPKRKSSLASRSRSESRRYLATSETSTGGKKRPKSAASAHGLRKRPVVSRRANRHHMKVRLVESVASSSASLDKIVDISRWQRVKHSLIARKPSLQKDAFLQRYDPDEKFQTSTRGKRRRGAEELGQVPYSFVIGPEGDFMYLWLLLVTLSIVYNLWTIIAREAFTDILDGYEIQWFIADGVADIIYLGDILVQMRTGYLEMGMIVCDTRLLLRHYVNSKMFIWDLVSLTPLDLIQLYIGIHPIVRFPRFLKVYRTFQFMYIIGMKAVYPNLWRVANLVHLLLLGSHWFAAFYFLISKIENYEGAWSYPLPVDEHAHVLRKYLKSLHWATMTLTNIGDKNQPESTYE